VVQCAAVLAVTAGALIATVAPAHAAAAKRTPRSYSYSAPQPRYTITFAARDCPAYSDVMANRARNNIMETLQDLGKDSVYTGGQAVDPSIEEPNDPDCKPLNGWQFQMGSGYGKSGQLSHVTGSPLIVTGDTKTNVPVLNPDGTPSGKTLDGALIYSLTDQQVKLAQQGYSLWVQGGTVASPQLENRYGDKYGFASLRCSVDNNNADNVEFVAYPSGYRNVFCYAYYVSPAPTPAEVTITKVIAGNANTGITQGFTFDSNLSYDPSGTFALGVANGNPASQDFIRANSTALGGPYNVKEKLPDGWKLDDITCSRTGTAATASTWTIDKSTASVAISLSGKDHVTCVYTDSPPLAPTLVIWKVTSGRAGGPFSFEVRGPVNHDLTATTTAAEEPEEAKENGTSPTDYTPGTYTITEKLPAATSYGSWELQQTYCNSHALKTTKAVDPTVTIDLKNNIGDDCFFRNVFKPEGQIRIRLKTIGGTGTAFAYVTSPTKYPRPQSFTGTTVKDSEEVTAGYQEHLPFENYKIQSAGPVADPTKGSWTFVSFSCSVGDFTRSGAQHVTIHLTEAKPKADCLAVYEWHPATTIEVVKIAQGTQAARSGPAVVRIGCADLARGRVVLDETASRATLPEPLYLHKDVTCQVSEPRNGAKAVENWTVKATLNGQRLAVPGSFQVATSGPRKYVVTVTNHYRAARIPGS
jgi:hypothetical protein